MDHILLERRRAVHGLPKAHIVSAKTMEIFRQLGLDEEFYRRGGPIERFSRFNWMTSLAGPTPLHGREIGHVDAWGGGEDVTRYANATPCEYTNLTQIQVEPLLNEEAKRCAPGRIQYGQELLKLKQDDSGVTARVRNVENGVEWEVRSEFVLGTDGGRSVGREVGVGWVGQQELGQALIIHFSAQLHPWIKDPRQAITIFLSPDNIGHGLWSGALVKMGPTRWGTDSEEWVCHIGMPETGIPQDEAVVVDMLRTTIGIPDLEPVIHSVGGWSIGGVVAEKLHIGRILLLGDSAHRHPPAGGLGLNTAVADAQNATWKVAQITKGNATLELLHSYEEERLPIARTVVQQALTCLGRQTEEVAAVLRGFERGQAGWNALDRFFADSPEGEQLRTEMAQMFRKTNFGTRMLGVELGQQYVGGGIVSDGSRPKPNPDPIIEYVPEARPGHRVPHAWIYRGSQRKSTIDLAVIDRFVLVTQPTARREWLEAIAAAAGEVGTPIDLVTIGENGDYEDSMNNWAALNGLSEGGAVLIRPDSFVGWRTVALPKNPGQELTQVLTTILGKARALTHA
ncbi:UNVERIFIED_ORG: 2,4-dichlorophenol 6-monooxygenase [Xanthobacter viscosus]